VIYPAGGYERKWYSFLVGPIPYNSKTYHRKVTINCAKLIFTVWINSLHCLEVVYLNGGVKDHFVAFFCAYETKEMRVSPKLNLLA